MPSPTTNMDPHLNPTVSYNIPATEGPTKRPKASTELHRPDTTLYVATLSGKPLALQKTTFFFHFKKFIDSKKKTKFILTLNVLTQE